MHCQTAQNSHNCASALAIAQPREKACLDDRKTARRSEAPDDRMKRASEAKRAMRADAAGERRAASMSGSSEGEAPRLLDEAHHPDPVPQRGGDAAGDAGRPAAFGPRHRRHRSRWSSTTDRATAPRTSRAPPASTTSCGCAATRDSPPRSWPASTRRSSSGADFIVNTDADNQYPGHEIPKLLAAAPQRRGRHRHRRSQHRRGPSTCRGASASCSASAAGSCGRCREHVGARHDQRVPRLHARGGAADDDRVGVLLHARVDHPGRQEAHGDRARAGCQTNPRTRDSRLFDSVFSYIKRSAATIVRIYAMYEPLKVFTYIGLLVFSAGFMLGLRFLYHFFFQDRGIGHIQSLILAAVLMIVGFQVVLIGLLADVISANRKLLEDLVYRVRSLEMPLNARRDRDEPREPRSSRADGAGTLSGGALDISIVIPAFNEARDRRRRDRRCAPPARGTRSSSSTTDRATGPASTRRGAGATVVRHPYNKGNGAAVKTGIRTGHRRVRAHHRRRRAAQSGGRAAARRAARRIRPRDRRTSRRPPRRRTRAVSATPR